MRASCSRCSGRRWTALAGALWIAFLAQAAFAQSTVSLSPDVTIALGPTGFVVGDQEVVVDDLAGGYAIEPLVAIPAPADVTGFARSGAAYALSFAQTTSLPGGLVVQPGDVALADASSTYSLFFDGSLEGLPDGVKVDAVSFAPGGLLLSFDRTVDVGGFVVADEDLVRWKDGAYSLVFDGSDAGLDRSVDVDGAQDLAFGNFLVSFDTTGIVAGIVFRDEDVLRYENGAWSVEFDAPSLETDWIRADVDAFTIPEPGNLPAIVSGVLSLAALGRTRRRRKAGRRTAWALFACALLASPAGAADGRVEIDHECASKTGCLEGDSAGYPVTIDGTGGRSVVLTSDLVTPDVDTHGILVTASDVTVDLGGFSIFGPGCLGAESDCTPTSGSAVGVGVDSSLGTGGLVIRNGQVVGFHTGVATSWAGEVRDVLSRWNRDAGLGGVGYGSLFLSNAALENGQWGIVGATSPAALVVGNRVIGNGWVGLVSISGAVVSENVVANNARDGIVVAAGSVVTDNVAFRNVRVGIEATHGVAVISDNSTYDNQDGIRALVSTAVVISTNTARDSTNVGLQLGSGAGYRENVITNNGAGDVAGGLSLGANACTGPTACP